MSLTELYLAVQRLGSFSSMHGFSQRWLSDIPGMSREVILRLFGETSWSVVDLFLCG
jgi:hypothetical protein